MNARMISPPLPLPGAAEELASLWLTRGAAARALGVDQSTISRWTQTGIITAHYPRSVPGERAAPLYYGAEVDRLVEAKALLTPDRPAGP